MAILNKNRLYDEFSLEDGKYCIGGKEIFHIWKSVSGWVWYATKVVTKDKIPSIYEGYVQGNFNEWGSWYASDMKDSMIQEIPKENWDNVIKVTQ